MFHSLNETFKEKTQWWTLCITASTYNWFTVCLKFTQNIREMPMAKRPKPFRFFSITCLTFYSFICHRYWRQTKSDHLSFKNLQSDEQKKSSSLTFIESCVVPAGGVLLLPIVPWSSCCSRWWPRSLSWPWWCALQAFSSCTHPPPPPSSTSWPPLYLLA